MRIVINLRDPKAPDWDGFWMASKDPDAPVNRFGMRMFVRDLTTDATRIATVLRERMKWVKQTLRAEEDDLRRRPTQMVRDCKSHRAIGRASRSMEHHDRVRTEMIRYINEMLN